MAEMYGNRFSNVTKWPLVADEVLYNNQNLEYEGIIRVYVVMKGHYRIAQDLVAISSVNGAIFCPIVYPDEVEEFERFALKYYDSDPNVPEGAGGS
jgi:hypothetical protein